MKVDKRIPFAADSLRRRRMALFSIPPRQLWVTAFPALAGLTVALGSIGGGGSLWQAGAAGLATGMTGYVASALSGSEAKTKLQLLEHSLEHSVEHLQNRQNQPVSPDLNSSDLEKLAKSPESLAELQAAPADGAQAQENRTPSDKTADRKQEEPSRTPTSRPPSPEHRLRAEEQSLKDSIQQLQAKRQKLIQYLKEGAAQIEQLKTKRDLLKQEIAALTRSRQVADRGRSQAATQAATQGVQDIPRVTFGRAQFRGTAPSAVSVAEKYDAVLAAIEEQVENLENKAAATAERAPKSR